MLYVVDTSALIDAWRKWYAPESNPAFWSRLELLAVAGHATVPDAVLLELEDKDDDVYHWVRDRRTIMVTDCSAEVQQLVSVICNRYRNMRTSPIPSKGFADPFVIALAMSLRCSVVTHESATGNLHGPKIPDVCRAEGVRPMQMYQLVREQNWVFN